MINPDCVISVIAPLHNDSDIIDSFVDELADSLQKNFAVYEIVLVDDGSTDRTVPKVNDLLSKYQRIRLIRLSRRFGQEIAISAGLDSVIGDFVVVMLPDTDPPSLLPEMVNQARGGAEMVFGIRKSRATDPWFLKSGASLFYWFCNAILRLNLQKNSTHFRVLSRRVVNALIQIRDRGRYLRTLSQQVGFENRSFEYALIERRSPPRTKSFAEAVGLAINIVVANTRKPLRVASWVGLAIAALNAAFVFYLGALYLLDRNVTGIAAAIQGAVMFGFLFLILAILCEYVGRIVDESQGRPLYYVMDENNSSVLPLDERTKNVVTESAEN